MPRRVRSPETGEIIVCEGVTWEVVWYNPKRDEVLLIRDPRWKSSRWWSVQIMFPGPRIRRVIGMRPARPYERWIYRLLCRIGPTPDMLKMEQLRLKKQGVADETETPYAKEGTSC